MLLQDWHSWSECEDRGPAVRWWHRRWRNSAQYCFTDHWKVKSSVEEVAALFLDTPSLSEWWPQLGGVTMQEPGGRHGASRAFTAQAKGFLPYALDLQFRVVSVQFPRQFSVELTGDLRGEGGGFLRQDGSNVAIEMTLKIRLTRPLLQVLSLFARPALVAQHQFVMRCGEAGLRTALARRRASSMATPL